MLSSHKAVRPQRLHPGAALSTSFLRISHGHPSGSQKCCRSPSDRRSFSWRTKRLSGSHHEPGIYKSSISYVGPTGASYGKTLYRSYFWKPGHFLNQYTQSPEWRLLSSWGKSSGGARGADRRLKDDGPYQETKEDDWYSAWQKRHTETWKTFDGFKKLIDEDPYKALFGRNLPESWYASVKASRRREAPEDRSSPMSETDAGEAKTKKADSFAKPFISTNEGASPPNTSSPVPSSQSEDLVIDPITMRKIPKATLKDMSPPVGSSTSNESVNIPVKPFKPSSSEVKEVNVPKNGKPAVEKARAEKRNWLMQEGFGKSQEDKKMPSGKQQASSPRIESALDRHQKKPRSVAAEERKEMAALKYDPKEVQTEDIDLPTASEIRASAGRVGTLLQETAQEKQARREVLEKDYNERPQALEKRLEEEFAAQRIKSERTLMRELEEIAKEQRKRDAARTAHEEEVKTQKAAMEAHETRRSGNTKTSSNPQAEHPQQGEGDMASNVHEFGSRERWYKRQAPHANAKAERKLLQATKDKAFVREIKSIYEDTYGTIDTEHRQVSTQPSVEASEYPSDAYPGTVYEQPWTANVLNDHPDIDARGTLSATEESQLQDHYEKQKFQALSLIGKLFSEMRENQALLQEHREQLQELATKENCESIFQSLKAREQRIMHTLKAAQNLFKSTTTTVTKNNASDIVPPPSASATPATDDPKPEEDTSEKDTPAPPTLYKILAYDPSSERVTTTKTTNVVGPVNGKALTFSEALFGLENPAKFLPHFTALKHGEYEIAAGGPNILIFKKVRQLKPSLEEKAPEERLWYANPIDGMVVQTGNFASPTGFVNYDPPLPEPELQDPPEAAPNTVTGKDKVHRQEEVFSGSSRRALHDQYERGTSSKAQMKGKHRRTIRRRRTMKRMLLVGALTAAGCYAVGVASEFLRM